jgi:hypothetical protein
LPGGAADGEAAAQTRQRLEQVQESSQAEQQQSDDAWPVRNRGGGFRRFGKRLNGRNRKNAKYQGDGKDHG